MSELKKTLIGCRRCGNIVRGDVLEGIGQRCPECGAPMSVLPLDVARRLASKRRAADHRRTVDEAIKDVGLDPEIEI
jgi:hypothetical protein